MVGRADQGAGLGELVLDALQLVEGVDLPGEVVEPDGGPPGLGRACSGADLEQAEVVIVAAALGLQERGPGEAHDDAEAEDVGVEGDAALDVADVEDGVVETLHRHGSTLRVFA